MLNLGFFSRQDGQDTAALFLRARLVLFGVVVACCVTAIAGLQVNAQIAAWNSVDTSQNQIVPTTEAAEDVGPSTIPVSAKEEGLAAAVLLSGPAAAPFEVKITDAETRSRSVECLTSALYYEAALEGEEGQRAVAQVVLNRVRHPAYPNSVCGVVYQGSGRSTGCQFTFTCDGSLARRPMLKIWQRSERIAKEMLAGQVFAPVGYSTHYHADYVAPYWRLSLRKTAAIGKHIFYRWQGPAGAPSAFIAPYTGSEPTSASFEGYPTQELAGIGTPAAVAAPSAPRSEEQAEELDSFDLLKYRTKKIRVGRADWRPDPALEAAMLAAGSTLNN